MPLVYGHRSAIRCWHFGAIVSPCWDMIDGSADEIVEAWVHWATSGSGQMALITYRGELSRVWRVEDDKEAGAAVAEEEA